MSPDARNEILKECPTLRLEDIVTFASGNISRKHWNLRFRFLKDAIIGRRLVPDRNAAMPPNVGTAISASKLYEFAHSGRQPDWVVQFAEQWVWLSGAAIPPWQKEGVIAREDEDACLSCLTKIMEGGNRPSKNKDVYQEEMKSKFSVSENAFKRLWAEAIKITGNMAFKKPGPKSGR